MGKEKVVATAISLMDKLLIRVGNQSYAAKNKSFGLTTLRKRHVRAAGRVIRFIFLGKSGRKWNLQLSDRRILRLIRAIQELPGQQLFQYLDDSEQCCPVTSDDINAYLREATRSDYTSRHFRT
jgi:DNA topoisomerase-1